jgi:type III secretory pathway component EscT
MQGESMMKKSIPFANILPEGRSGTNHSNKYASPCIIACLMADIFLNLINILKIKERNF